MSTEEKMPVGGILVGRNLGMLAILGTPKGPGIAGDLLETLGRNKVNVEFISSSPEKEGGDSVVLCVSLDHLEEAYRSLEAIQDRLAPARIEKCAGLVSLAVYGPHFREIPAVAGRVFRALADAGVEIKAISTSISSITSIIEEGMLDQAMEALKQRFDVG